MITKNMKYVAFISSLCLIFLTSLKVYSQTQDDIRPSFGVKAGVNFSNLYIDDVNDEKVRIGFNAGLYGNFPIGTKYFSIQPELSYSTKGNRTTYNSKIFGSGEVKFNLDYLEFPLLAVVGLGDYFQIQAGGYGGYLISSNIVGDGDNDLLDYTKDIDEDQLNRFDYGLAFGLGFKSDMIGGGVRYNYGLQTIANSNSTKALLGDSKNSTLQVYVTLGF